MAPETLTTVRRGSTAADVEALCAATGYSRFPVEGDDGELLGYLHIKDVLETDEARRQRVIEDKWTRPFATVTADDLLHDALETLQRRGAHMARVVDQDGATLGVATLEDVIEELVGEIRDAAHHRRTLLRGRRAHRGPLGWQRARSLRAGRRVKSRLQVGTDTTRDTRVWTLPNLLSMVRLAGVPLFLWLVLGPEADGWALVVLMVSGVTDYLDGWLARRLNQTTVLGPDPRPGGRPALHPGRRRRAGPARRDPVVAGDLAAAARPADVGAGAAAAHPRLQLAARALPRQGRDVQPALRLPAAAARRRRRRVARLAEVFGWAFAFWGVGLYWWAGVLYAWQVRGCSRPPSRARPRRRADA